jgi:hypothetical protein
MAVSGLVQLVSNRSRELAHRGHASNVHQISAEPFELDSAPAPYQCAGEDARDELEALHHIVSPRLLPALDARGEHAHDHRFDD